MFSDLRVNMRCSCPIFMKLDFSRQFFEKYSDNKFHENPSSGSRVVPCGQAHGRTDWWKDITKLTVALRNFAKAPNNEENIKIGTKYLLMILLCKIW